MTITFTITQIIILITSILFFLAHVISIFIYKKQSSYTTIEIFDTLSTWNILNQTNKYHLWWSKFKDIENVSKHLVISNKNEGNFIKFSFYSLDDNNTKETWIFIIKKSQHNTTLFIKKDYKKESTRIPLLNIILFHNKDINIFVKNFQKRVQKISAKQNIFFSK